METSFDPNYIEARETLLDAVEALEPHSNAVILVGAQAVYVHTESEDESFAVAPFTYDADIALDPRTAGRQSRASRRDEPGGVSTAQPTGAV